MYNQKKGVNVMGLKEQARRIIKSERRAGAIGRTTEAVLVSMRMKEEKKDNFCHCKKYISILKSSR